MSRKMDPALLSQLLKANASELLTGLDRLEKAADELQGVLRAKWKAAGGNRSLITPADDTTYGNLRRLRIAITDFKLITAVGATDDVPNARAELVAALDRFRTQSDDESA